jgi:serine/threonine protein phosphatase PrpC
MAPLSSTESTLAVEWGVAARPLHATEECGDTELVAFSPPTVVVAVADGLGHGAEAAVAAKAVASVLTRHAGGTPTDLILRCHEELRRTRGAVVSLASFDTTDDRMTWLGVGNVEGILVRQDDAAQPRRHALLLRSGVVGYRLPTLRTETLQVSPGDRLILATDGIRSDFSSESPFGRTVQELADHILARHGKPTDDALVLVARYLGRAS